MSNHHCGLSSCTFKMKSKLIDAKAGASLLTLKGISRTYATGVGVQDIDLTLRAGEILGICGVSGCGKSTLLRLVAGREITTAGNIERGFKRLGMVFQEPHLLPWLTAQENVALVMRNRAEENRKAASDILESVGLANFLDQYPAQLSGGMRQRVGIARALAADPDLLLMDEPFSSLDYFTSLDLLDLVRQQVAERHIAVIFVSHDVREVARLCDRVLVMGGSPGHLLEELPNPLSPGERERHPGASARFEDMLLMAIRNG